MAHHDGSQSGVVPSSSCDDNRSYYGDENDQIFLLANEGFDANEDVTAIDVSSADLLYNLDVELDLFRSRLQDLLNAALPVLPPVDQGCLQELPSDISPPAIEAGKEESPRPPWGLQLTNLTADTSGHDSGYDQTFFNASSSGSPSVSVDYNSDELLIEVEIFHMLVRLQTLAACISTTLRRSEYSV